MRIIDLHCYPGTKEWIACQGPYVDALAKYWNRGWTAKTEDEVIREFTDAGVEALLGGQPTGAVHDGVPLPTTLIVRGSTAPPPPR